MKSFATIFTSSALLSLFLSTPLSATSNEYVVLESITAVNSTVTLGDNLEYELVVSSPTTFDWDPTSENIDGRLSILLCSESKISLINSVYSCDYSNQQNKYQLRVVTNIGMQTIDNHYFYTFKVSGIPTINQAGIYFPYSVKIINASIDFPEFTTHFYNLSSDHPTDGFSEINELNTPELVSRRITVEEVITIQPEPEVSAEVEESVPEQVPTSTPQPSAGSSSNQSVTAIVTPAIQSNFMLPAIKGDQNWRPLKGIKGNFENWKVANKNSLAGVPVRFTKTNGSMITFTTVGDAVSVRYLAGKKRGSFSIYVNGKFLERIDTSKKNKQSLVKSWNNLGEGKHYIDIVAELDNGQSLAISGVQKLKD